MTMASTAFKKVKGNLERIFEKNLNDLVRGIRNNRDNEAKYIAQCIEEIKQELKQDNMAVKAVAVAKLSYLQMFGYDIGWAAFNIIEVMSSTKFTYKRIGYLAASQCFHDNTEVLMLTTNMIRKDCHSSNTYDAGVALSGLACFVTTDLARDLANDMVTLLSSSKPYIRKKAALLLYKVFLKYPDSLRPTFPRLKDKLEDSDPGVQSAAVNVICELARKNPKNYLSLAPMFFKLMTASTNNWMLIKIIKLFGALTPLEPRLGKKLIEPLTNLINSTSAMSLLYECINTVIAVLVSISSGVPGDHSGSIQLCVQKLSILIEDSDQNLKYLGLLALGKILETHPKAVQSHKDLILNCLDDKDESIRLRALDLLYGMVSKKNITDIIKKLMVHVENAEGTVYRDELLAKIIQICSHNNYQYVTNFEWYVSVLVQLTHVGGTNHGALIAEQLLDVAVRVQSIRHFAVSQSALLIENAHVLLGFTQMSNISEVLYAAAWICGEFSEHLRNPQTVLESMLRTKVSSLPGHIQSYFVQNIGKLYSEILTVAEREEDWDRVFSLDNLILSKLPHYELSDNLEVQERACSFVQLMKHIDALHKQNDKVAPELALMFQGELNPIAPKAQRKVPPPQGLDLDAWINAPPETSSEDESDQGEAIAGGRAVPGKLFTAQAFQQEIQEAEAAAKKRAEPTPDELKKLRDAREQEMASNPHYLKTAPSKTKSGEDFYKHLGPGRNSLPEVTPIDLPTPLEIPGMVGLDAFTEQQEQTVSWKKAKKHRKGAKGTRKSKHRRGHSSSEEELNIVHEVNRDLGEMPDGAKSTDDETPQSSKQDPFRALDVDLDEPLREDERLPVLQHRITSPQQQTPVTSPTPPLIHEPSPHRPKHHRKHKKGNKDSTEKTGDATVEKKKKKRDKSGTGTAKMTQNGDPQLIDVTHIDKDLDIWMDSGSGSPGLAASVSTEFEQIKRQSHKEEHKRHRKTSSRSKKGKSKEEMTGGLKISKDRSEYEIASGICTPSQEHSFANGETAGNNAPGDSVAVNSAGDTMEMSNMKLLADSEHLKLMYSTETSLMDPSLVVAKVVLWNKSQHQPDQPHPPSLSKMEWTILDTLNARMANNPSLLCNGLIMMPGQSHECLLSFNVQSINMPQKLRGTISYMISKEDGVVTDKVDFCLRFPCIAFTTTTTLSRESFAELLSGVELPCKHSVKFDTPPDSFDASLAKICFHAHFTVVERVEQSASLYSQTTQNHPICLLVKVQGDGIWMDGKSSDHQLLQYVMEEIRDLCLQT